MAAQQGTGQTVWQSHYDVFHPGMIASQYPHSIKSALLRASATGEVLKFGTACGRYGADTQIPQSADNFDGSAPTGGVRYAAGGGAYVTDTISYETLPAGNVNAGGSNPVIGSATNTLLRVDQPGHEEIKVGDLVKVTKDGATDFEIMRIMATAAVAASHMDFTVRRGQYGSTARADFADGDKVEIYGRSNTFAGVALKDITIEGRWVVSERDSFIDGDEVPVGIEGDFAVLLDFDTQSSAVTGGIVPDRPVSVRLNNTGNTRNGYVYRPRATRNKNLFASDNFQDANTIIVKGARYVTGPYEATLHPQGPRGPGSDPHAQTVVCASVRFAGNV